jgi:hypothetical protein
MFNAYMSCQCAETNVPVQFAAEWLLASAVMSLCVMLGLREFNTPSQNIYAVGLV